MSWRTKLISVLLTATAVAAGGCGRERYSEWRPAGEMKPVWRRSESAHASQPQRLAQRLKTRTAAERTYNSAEDDAAQLPSATEPSQPAAPSAGSTASAAAPAQPAARSAVASAANTIDRADQLVGSRRLLQQGKVLQARLELYALLSKETRPDALLELARTYDAYYLNAFPRTDAVANPELAREYYKQSQALGSADAAMDLQRLEAGKK